MGEIFKKMKEIRIPEPWLEGVELDATINGFHVGKRRVLEGKIALTDRDDAFYAIAGFLYDDKLDFLPAQGGSVLGSSHGSQGQLKNVIISVYKSRPCRAGVNGSAYASIPYDRSDVDDQFVFSGDVKAFTPHAGPYADRGLSIRSNPGEPFNLVSITYDAWVSDN
jgi:hypothetical protein